MHYALTLASSVLDALADRLRGAGAPREGPVEHDGGDRSVYWTDPSGHRGEAWDLFAIGGSTDDVVA